MPRRTAAPVAVDGIDHTSGAVALAYLGSEAGEPAVLGIPARDLSGGDLARLVYVESHGSRREETAGAEGLRPGDDEYPKALGELVARLVDSKVYSADPTLLAERNRPAAPAEG